MGTNDSTVRALLTVGMVAVMAILTWTLAPLRSAATPYFSAPNANPTPSLQQEPGRPTSGLLTDPLSAAGTAAAQGVVAFRCDVQEPKGSDDPAAIDSRPELVVLAPAELGGSYAVSGPITLELNEDGVGVVDFPEGGSKRGRPCSR